MHPTLVEIGRLSIHSYGFMLALSFLAGIYLAAYRARKRSVDVQHILDLSVYIILSAVIGSRLAYIAFHLEDYESLLDVFALWQGGATLYGGLLLAVLAAVLFSVRRRLDFFLLADIVVPSIALGTVFTRVGCFLSGCCFGRPTEWPWGVVFPPFSPAGTFARSLGDGALALHPTQLYASFANLVIFITLIRLDGVVKKRGAVFGTYLVLYGIARFAVDFFRYYEPNMVAMGLSLNQVLSLLLIVVGLYLNLRKAGEKGSA